jgi:hypothetical protein
LATNTAGSGTVEAWPSFSGKRELRNSTRATNLVQRLRSAGRGSTQSTAAPAAASAAAFLLRGLV